MKRDNALRKEVRAIRRSPAFRRSRLLSNILEYLLEIELTEGAGATQEKIAADVMGKDLLSWDPTDSAVRVAIARLRVALSQYYAHNLPSEELCVYIPKGEYRIHFANLSVAYPAIAEVAHRRSPSPPPWDSVDSSGSNGSDDFDQTEEAHSVDGHQFAKRVTISQINEPLKEEKPEFYADNPVHNDPSEFLESVTAKTVTISPRVPTDGSAAGRVGKAKRTFANSFRARKTIRGIRRAGVIGIVMVLAVVSAFFVRPSRPAIALASPSESLQVPQISAAISVAGETDHGLSTLELQDELRKEVTSLLQKSMISRHAGGSDNADLQLVISVTDTDTGEFTGNIVLLDRSNRVVTERSLRIVDDIVLLKDTISDEITGIISPAGHVARSLVSQVNGKPENGFECFLVIENFRTTGEKYEDTLERCIGEFPESEFAPYLEVRRAFGEAQKSIATGKSLNPSDSSWKSISHILSRHPENPYANAVAAKFLIGRGLCSEAAAFATEGFSRGRTYPTLELAVIVDAYGCEEVANIRPFWNDRIKKIILANPDPDPLLETYMLLGAVISEQRNELETQKSRLFSMTSKTPLDEINTALWHLVDERASANEKSLIRDRLSAFLFSPQSREAITKAMRRTDPSRSS